jgi:hypothetical protein
MHDGLVECRLYELSVKFVNNQNTGKIMNAQITGMPDQIMSATELRKYNVPEIQRRRLIHARPLCRAYTRIETIAGEVSHHRHAYRILDKSLP